MDIMQIAISQIRIDPELQPRVAGVDPDHVREIQDAFELCPPIKVVKSGDKYVLLDGFHRFAAGQNLGRETIAAEVIEPSDNDLFAAAFQFNAVHGKPLTLSDRRNYAAHILRAEPRAFSDEIESLGIPKAVWM